MFSNQSKVERKLASSDRWTKQANSTAARIKATGKPSLKKTGKGVSDQVRLNMSKRAALQTANQALDINKKVKAKLGTGKKSKKRKK